MAEGDLDTSFSSLVEKAAAGSLLKGFPAAEKTRLLSAGRRVDVAAGSTLFLGATPQPALVVTGLIRVFMTSADGRQVTVHYVKEGGTLGILAMVGGPPPVRLQAIVPTTVLVLEAAGVRAVATSNPAAGWAVAEEFAAIYVALLNHLSVNVFGTVRQRVCSHLLSMAAAADDGLLVAGGVTQQDLANAVGTAREVVSRTLGALSRAGIVSVSRDRIVIAEPAKMVDEVGSLSSL